VQGDVLQATSSAPGGEAPGVVEMVLPTACDPRKRDGPNGMVAMKPLQAPVRNCMPVSFTETFGDYVLDKYARLTFLLI
jgi:hypothetical protein